LRSRIHIRMS